MMRLTLCCLLLMATVGCADIPIEKIDTALQQSAMTAERVDALETQVVKIEADVATTVGGGGDSVTAWIYALIAGAAVLYPVIWRPIRLRLGSQSRSTPK